MNNKAIIGDKIYDIIGLNEYNPNIFDPKTTAIIKGDTIYPVKTNDESGVGCYISPNNPIQIFEDPKTPEEVDMYHMSDDNIVDFKNVKTMADCIVAKEKFLSMEMSILTSPDNIFSPPIGENDKPAMKALKEATNEKSIDIDKYSPRFGPNYGNTKRLFKDSDITLNKLVYIADMLDMKCTLTIEDASPDVPNPIGRTITTVLTSTDSDESK